MKGRSEPEDEEIADDLIDSLHHHDQHAGVHLARLILADKGNEGGAYRAFASALAKQLQHWSGTLRAIREDDVARMMKAAARELVDKAWDD